jgi:molybdopterin synthase catalytic subunit
MKVLFFARARELAEVDAIDLDLPESSVGELRRALAERLPRLASFLPVCAIAVNDDFVDDGALVPADATVAVLPPVSGGSGL